MKNDVLWDVTPCGSCENRLFEERIDSIIRAKRIRELETTLAAFLRSVLQLLVTAKAIPSSLIVFTLIKEMTLSSEISVIARTTRRHIPEDGIPTDQQNGSCAHGGRYIYILRPLFSFAVSP
jgi:hypothetical protein